MQLFVRPMSLYLVLFVLFSVGAFADPDWSLDANSLSFSAYEGVSSPSDDLLTITNVGDETLNWNVYDTNDIILSLPEWLNVTPTSGSVSAGQSGYVIIQANTTGLPGGTYEYAFDVVDPTVMDSPQRVDVSLEVIGAILEVSSEAFVFPFDEANFNTEQILTLGNPGGGLLNWSFCDPNETFLTLPDWLEIDSVSGNLAHDAAEDVILTVGSTTSNAYS